MLDDVVDDRLGREQQPPVERHRAGRRARGPARALAADRQPVVGRAGARARGVEPRRRSRPARRGGTSARAPAADRPPARAARRRAGARACAPARRTRVSGSPRNGTVPSGRADLGGGAGQRAAPALDPPGAARAPRRAPRARGARRGSTTSTAPSRLHAHAHPPRARRAADRVRDVALEVGHRDGSAYEAHRSSLRPCRAGRSACRRASASPTRCSSTACASRRASTTGCRAASCCSTARWPRSGRLGFWRWFMGAWGIGTYGKNDQVDVAWEVDGAPRARPRAGDRAAAPARIRPPRA